ncbi:GntR family transcriptional regulator [Pseudonocardia acaciae]|uniref:GntR family transcriptional regulator n=1 Tax=Pseudonocardia acaciae TaxID=551276 RepID=UPI0004918249|nr:GntR family transcriptional regulator [Pseudonocardia acaciae]
MGSYGLLAYRALPGRTSTSERVARILRSRISAGDFPPGTRLAEEEIIVALGVTRATLREAFRLLTYERLLVHRPNGGMFVRVLGVADVVDLYRLRRLVECATVRDVEGAPPDLTRLADAVERGRAAIDARDWRGLATADIVFHEAVAELSGSVRVRELMQAVLAELRLVFSVMENPRRFHEPYLNRNREILAALQRGSGAHAAKLLSSYLGDAERQLVEACAPRTAVSRT